LWDLTPQNTPSKPGKKREFDNSPEGDEVDVDHGQETQASTLKIHHWLAPPDILLAAQKAETEVTLATFSPLDFTPAVVGTQLNSI